LEVAIIEKKYINKKYKTHNPTVERKENEDYLECQIKVAN